jgi:PAS domain S-box-containing protein
MISYNNQFARLWNIPQAIIDAKDDRAALEFAMTQVADPQAFIDRVEYCYAYPNEAAYEQIPFADGRIIERYGNAVIGEDGASYGWIWYFRDITEQKKAEEKLRENEERFRTFADNIQNLAWIADAEGWIYWYNQRWYDYTGTTFEEMQGWGWEKVHHPDHSERVVNFVKEAWKKSEPFELTFPLRGRDGNFQWFLTRAVPIVDAEGKITRWIGTNTNINEQKLAQQKIEQSEAALNELANAMPQLVWIADATGAVTYYNNQLAGFANALKDEQDKWQWDSLVHVDDLQKTAEAWAAAVNAGTIYQVEHRIQMRDGKYRWYLSRGIPQKDVAGNVVKWFGTATDIHEQKQFTERLEKLVTERTKALQQSNDNLQQFAHVASHDLKEPVRKIKTFTSRLENELQNVLNEKSKLYLDKVQRATERMFVMIDGVLTYSTIDASKQAVELVDLNDIFKNIETDLEILIQQTGTRILYRDLPSVEGSSVLLYQLFYNLMNNAIKFARKGVPPVISVGFSIAHQEGQEFAQILFNDNGIGFEQEQAEKIFETFTRLHSKDKYEGTGLGLSLCKKIVERHGGRIQAKSRLDEGTTFIILLPLKHTSLGI